MTEFLDLSKGSFGGPGFLDLSAKGLNLYQPQGNRYKGYSFYVDFLDGVGRDRVSKTLMETTLSAGRVNADGTVLGANVPAIQGGKLNTLGQIPLLNGMTDDLLQWNKTPAVTVTPSTYKTTANGGLVYKGITTVENTIYTLSFYAYVLIGDNLNNYKFYHAGSATGDLTNLSLTKERKRYSVSVLGKVGGGSVLFGFSDTNTSGWGTVCIDTINITQSAYLLPPVHNDTINPITTPHNYSDADEGYKWPFAKCPKLLTSMQGTDGTNAMGALEVDWTPMYDQSIAPVSSNVISCSDAILKLLYYNTGQLKTYDNTTISSCSSIPWLAGTTLNIKLKYGPHPGYANAGKYQLIVTDGTTTWNSALTNFDGSFNPLTHFSIGWLNEFWQQISKISVKEANPWIA